MEIENSTPFEADRYGVADREGADLLVLVVKGTFVYGDDQSVEVAPEQQAIEAADRYYGLPEETSVEYASDFSIGKPGTDIALLGHAYPARLGQAVVDVGIQVGKLYKYIKVFGDRFWMKNFGAYEITAPVPFDRMPLRYERAFGGVDKSHPEEKRHEWEARNPVGVGFRAKKSQLPVERERLPNLEDPKALIQSPEDRPAPAGVGFIAPAWQPRLGYAGTYDAAWEQNRMPLLPDDFDDRFFNTAHPDLIAPKPLEGGEPVVLMGMSPRGTERFELPRVSVSCAVVEKASGEQPVELRIDKVVFEPDEGRFMMVWSGSHPPEREFIDIESVQFNIAS